MSENVGKYNKEKREVQSRVGCLGWSCDGQSPAGVDRGERR